MRQGSYPNHISNVDLSVELEMEKQKIYEQREKEKHDLHDENMLSSSKSNRNSLELVKEDRALVLNGGTGGGLMDLTNRLSSGEKRSLMSSSVVSDKTDVMSTVTTASKKGQYKGKCTFYWILFCPSFSFLLRKMQ